MKKTSQNYKSHIKPVWCPGCSNFVVFQALQDALATLNLAPENILMISGIGCSGRLSHFFNTYSLHGTHGRAVPTALGAKTARSELTVIAAGGDGDGLSIGGGHIVHAARKNTDITYILIDNQIYGLTKGQASPTTPSGGKTKTSPSGVYESPMDVIPILLAYDASFVARTSYTNRREMTEVLQAAIAHKGFSVVQILSLCRTYPLLDIESLKAALRPLPESYPRDDKLDAMKMAYATVPFYTGIFYQDKRPTLEDNLKTLIEGHGKEKERDLLRRLADIIQGYI